MSQPKPAWQIKADGQPAQDGLITIRTAGSIWWLQTTLSGRRKPISGAANTEPGYRSYCHPGNYRGQKTKLYHNNHDGTFTDVSDASGVGKPESKGMGVVLADFNNDGWPDIAIANDSWPNFLFINKHDGTFEDVSLYSGVAASEEGRYEAGMGIDAADVDGDGWQDIYITHLDFELNRLYHNNRDGTFTDDTYRSGIGNKAMHLSGVSMKFLDYDNDGWPDILQLNGAMLDNIQLYHSEVSYKEPLLMFRNLGKGQFEKVSDSLGPDFMRPDGWPWTGNGRLRQ